MLTYATRIAVKLDGRPIGEIRQVPGGWQYFPKGHKEGGDVFPTLEGCKRSLELPA